MGRERDRRWRRRDVLRLGVGAALAGACSGPPPPSPLPAPAPAPRPPPERLAPEGPLRWDPGATSALIVGVLRWADAESWPALPRRGRGDADLVRMLGERGVPASRVRFLRDVEASQRAALEALERSLADTRPGETWIFYWSGHGAREESGRTWLVPHDAGADFTARGVALDAVVATIERGLRAERALLFADCCYSGALVELAARSRSARLAALGSSSASETSTRRWTFTDALVAALAGAGNVDVDRDGEITFANLARFAEEEMAFADGQLSSAAANALFAPRFVLGAAAPLADPRFGERVEVRRRRRWWPATVQSSRGERLVVHYDGWDESWDEEVTSDDVRPYAPETFAAGTRVEVRWRRRWLPASVLEARLGVHRVHYDGYADTWDEWVARDRIRRV